MYGNKIPKYNLKKLIKKESLVRQINYNIDK